MAVRIDIENPDDNDIVVDPVFLQEGSGQVKVQGKGCRLFIDRQHSAGAAIIVVENGGRIEIAAGCTLGGLQAYAVARGSFISINKNTGFNGLVYVTAHEAANVVIGEECLFGPDSSVSSSDVHRIIDLKTSRRLNPAGDISIGDRVWFGARSVILRNSAIGSDSVVGWGSVVKGRFPSNVVIAGMPARIIKKRIRWER